MTHLVGATPHSCQLAQFEIVKTTLICTSGSGPCCTSGSGPCCTTGAALALHATNLFDAQMCEHSITKGERHLEVVITEAAAEGCPACVGGNQQVVCCNSSPPYLNHDNNNYRSMYQLGCKSPLTNAL